MKNGLVVGKFYPPHNGHHYLIDYALGHADKVVVLVVDNSRYHIPAAVRQDWLQQRHPKADVRIIEDIGKDDDSLAWAKHTIKFLGYVPDAVFSSEDYGDAYAKFMGAKHYKVDRQRVHVPIAATKIRQDVLKYWRYMQPAVRAPFALRICVLGAESTGTTTLAKALAKHYKSPWSPEYGRLYSEAIDFTDHTWQSDEFGHIALMQQKMERQLAGQSHGLVICDTNAFATRLWHERYMGDLKSDADSIAAKDKVDLYILTGDEIPFEDDGLRDGEHIRHDMQQRFREELTSQPVPFIEVTGNVKQRLKAAVKQINVLLRKKVTI